MAHFRDLIKQNNGGVYSPSNKPSLSDLSGTAGDSSKLEGKTKAEVVAEARKDLASATHKHTAADVGALEASGTAVKTKVNTSTSTSFYGLTWHSGDTLYASGNQELEVRPSDGFTKIKHGYLGHSGLAFNNEGYLYPIGTDHRDAGMYGQYDSKRIGHIWSMGTAYKISADGADFGNLYGFAYKHTNNTTGGTMAGGHQAVWCENGTPKAALGSSGIWSAGHVTAAGVITTNGGIRANSEHLAVSADFNNYETSGFYNIYKGSGVTFTNAPSDFSYGTLQVIGRGKASGSFCTQIITYKDNGKQMIRTRNDGGFAWTSWRKIYSEVQKPSWDDIQSKPTTFSPATHNHDTAYLGKTAKASDSSKLNGVSDSTSATANTVAKRDASGDISCRLVRPNYADQTTISGGIAFRVNDSTDNYIRFCNDKAAIRSFIGAAASSHTHTMSNISDRATHAPEFATDLGKTNLNDLKTSAHAGFYYQDANADTANLNYPTAQAGSLCVQMAAGGVTQTYIVYNTGQMYTRAIYSNAWSSWRTHLDSANTPVENRRKITYGTAAPTGGANGDIYIQY
ncbi:TPA: pyocin knob domain-containing protein [Vibrio parahaemolyticus]